MKTPKVVQSPISTEYLTAGKNYDVTNVISSRIFSINGDDGSNVICSFTGCLHIRGLDWIIVE